MIDASRARELLARAREEIEREISEHGRDQRGELAQMQDERNPEDDAALIGDDAIGDALTQSLRARLQAIERAEKRLEEGTYGLSVASGEPIPAERLEAVPWAERTTEEEGP